MKSFVKSLLSDNLKDLLKRIVKVYITRISFFSFFNRISLEKHIKNKNLDILVVPEIKDKKFLEDIHWRLIYYLYPIRNTINSITYISNTSHHPINKPQNLSNELLNFTGLNQKFKTTNLNLIKKSKYQLILNHNKNFNFFNSKYKNKKNYMIDYINNKEASEWLINISLDTTNKKTLEYITNKSWEQYKYLYSKIKKQKVLVCGSGPSFEELSVDFQHYDVMICNSIVKNIDFIKKSKPKYLAFGDPVFHTGPSLYSERFRKDVKQLINFCNPYIFTLLRDFPIYNELFSKKELEKFIFIPTKKIEKFNLELEKKFYIKGTGNILTLFMLPIAMNLYTEINLTGFDGKTKSDNKYYWKHSSLNQYYDLLENVKQVHPGFFDKDDKFYDIYYENHINTVKQWLDIATIKKIKINNLTRSNIFDFQIKN